MSEKYYVVFNSREEAVIAKPKTDYIKHELQKRIDTSVRINPKQHWYLGQGEYIEKFEEENVAKYKSYVVLVDYDAHLTTDDFRVAEMQALQLEEAVDMIGGSEEVIIIGILK